MTNCFQGLGNSHCDRQQKQVHTTATVPGPEKQIFFLLKVYFFVAFIFKSDEKGCFGVKITKSILYSQSFQMMVGTLKAQGMCNRTNKIK